MYKIHSEVADVYNYILGYRSKMAAELVPEWMGEYINISQTQLSNTTENVFMAFRDICQETQL